MICNLLFENPRHFPLTESKISVPDTNVWYDRATVEQGRPNVINNDGLEKKWMKVKQNLRWK